MKLHHAGKQAAKSGDVRSFTGTAWRRTIAVDEAPDPRHADRVTFEPGARKVRHAHPHGRILVATAGIGRLQLEDAPLLVLRPGDGATIAGGEKHRHGAAPDQLFVHTSIQATGGDGEEATRLAPATDAEYAAEPTEAPASE